jgi:hypothetical protein
MINRADQAGLALAGLALATATLAHAVRTKALSVGEMRDILRDAHALVNDAAGFVVDETTTQMADDFLSAAEALAMPDAPRVSVEEFRRRKE